jgi:hypothetical protein
LAKIETADSNSPIAPVYFDSALIAKFYLNGSATPPPTEGAKK